MSKYLEDEYLKQVDSYLEKYNDYLNGQMKYIEERLDQQGKYLNNSYNSNFYSKITSMSNQIANMGMMCGGFSGNSKAPSKEEQARLERVHKEVALSTAVSERKAFTGFSLIFMAASWMCTYIGIAMPSIPMLCMAVLVVPMTGYALYTVRKAEHKVTDLLIDLI